MKISKQLEDALNEVSREVDAWPQWKRSLDPQNRRSDSSECSATDNSAHERIDEPRSA